VSGTTAVNANGSGVATFSNLSITGSVGARTLRFTSGSGQDVSSTVNVSFHPSQGTQTLAYCGSQLMDVDVPSASFARPRPVAVYIHGGAWTSGDRLAGLLLPELRTELLSRGYVVVSLDYRLADGTPGNEWPAQIHDAKCAIRHLRDRAGDYGADGRIGVWGASAGGHLASMLGVTDTSDGFEGNGGFFGVSSHVDAVAPIGSISDITGGPTHPELPFAVGMGGPGELTFGGDWPGPSQELTDASPITWASSDDPPFYIVHGDEDTTVLYPQAPTLETALLNAGVPNPDVTLLTVVNGGHNLNDVGMGTPSHTLAQVADLIADFFDDHVLN
jgi:acetyl esterase/lipase